MTISSKDGRVWRYETGCNRVGHEFPGEIIIAIESTLLLDMAL